MPTPPTLNIELQNQTTSNTVFAYITGHALDNNNALFLLKSDGKTPYYPSAPSDILQPLPEDCAIPLGPPGQSVTTTIPHLAGARIWFSVDAQLSFRLNPGPALVEPSVTNPSDANINLNWGFAEFTYNNDQLYANISYVDFVALPISLTLATSAGAPLHVTGMTPDGLARVCAALREQDAGDHAGWSSLIYQNDGKDLRVLSPNQGLVMHPELFQTYWQPYIEQVWSRYSSSGPLSVDTQAQWGTLQGQVANGQLQLGGQAFDKPSARDIFSCSTGTFAENGSAERGALIARLSAAFNRSTLLVESTLPDSGATYYQNPITNHYSRVVHEANADGRGYAFPYDDVGPTGGKDVSGAVNAGDPTLLTVAVGGSGVQGGEGTPQRDDGRQHPMRNFVSGLFK